MGPLSSTSHLSLPTWGHLSTLPRPVPPPGLHTFLWPHPAHQAQGPSLQLHVTNQVQQSVLKAPNKALPPAWVRLAGPLPTTPRNGPSRSGQRVLQPRPCSRTESALSGWQETQAKAAQGSGGELQKAQPSWASEDKPASWGSTRDSET